PVPALGGYLGLVPSGAFVRADITYLKQDFSVPLQVPKPGRWPAVQRFDFFVRERRATARDLREGLARTAAGTSDHHQAACFALRELTGLKPRQEGVAAWKKLILGGALDLHPRYRGFVAATALAVDPRGRAFVLDGNRLVCQEGNAKPEVWRDSG